MESSDQMREFNAFMKHVSEELGLTEFKGSESGLVSLAVDEDYVVNIQYIPVTGKMMVFMPFLDVTGMGAETLRELLAANLFGRETGGGWFGLERESGSLVYHYLVDWGLSDEPDTDEFIRVLEQILELVEIWRVHLTENSVGEPKADAEVPSLDDSLARMHFQDQIRP